MGGRRLFLVRGEVRKSKMISSALMCLALNVFWESRSEDVISQAAVAHVVLNRVRDSRYPNNACDVITEGKHWKGHPVKNACQFSWYCNSLSDYPKNRRAFKWAVHIARLVAEGVIPDPTGGSTHYHAHYVQPGWRTKKAFTARIGSHLFYK